MRIYQPPGQTEWYVEYVTADGSKLSRTTYKETRAEAEALCRDLRIAELEESAVRGILTAEVATSIMANRTITIAQLLTEFDAWYATTARSPRSHECVLSHLNQWARESHLSERLVASITTKEINAYVNGPFAGKLGTRRNRLSAIKQLFDFASIKSYLLQNPAALAAVNLRGMDHDQIETEHKKVFSDEDMEFVIESTRSKDYEPPALTPGFYHAAIILGRYLGLRLSDVALLQWASFKDATATVWTSKGQSRVQIPLHSEVINLLKRLPRKGKYLFPHEAEIQNDKHRRSILSCYFRRLFERLGFPEHSFHSLRATLATTMANRGASLQDIAQSLGHTPKSIASTEVYVKKPNAAKVSMR